MKIDVDRLGLAKKTRVKDVDIYLQLTVVG